MLVFPLFTLRCVSYNLMVFHDCMITTRYCTKIILYCTTRVGPLQVKKINLVTYKIHQAGSKCSGMRISLARVSFLGILWLTQRTFWSCWFTVKLSGWFFIQYYACSSHLIKLYGEQRAITLINPASTWINSMFVTGKPGWMTYWISISRNFYEQHLSRRKLYF